MMWTLSECGPISSLASRRAFARSKGLLALAEPGRRSHDGAVTVSQEAQRLPKMRTSLSRSRDASF
jgi:hypothetical protein